MRRAYVIGSNGPPKAGRLLYAHKDAAKLAAALSEPTCGFHSTLVNRDEKAAIVRGQLQEVVESCQPDDVFVCAFSGHGILDGGELYLLLESTDLDKLLSTSLSITEVVRAVQFCKAKSKLLVLDCCHAGTVTSMMGLKGAEGLPLEELGVPKEHFLVLMASGRLERARELREMKGGFLTNSIVKALHRGAEADLDRDGALSIEDMMGFLTKEAVHHNASSPSLAVPIPHLFGRQKGRFFFKGNPLWDWKPVDIDWIEGIKLVPAPVALFHRSYNNELRSYRPSADELPQYYAACLSKYPITNRQFHNYLSQTSQPFPVGQKPFDDGRSRSWVGPFTPMEDSSYNDPDQPVVCVSYDDAIGYCKWLNSQFDVDSRLGGSAWLPSIHLWDYLAYGSRYKTNDPSTWMSQTRACHHKASFPATIDGSGGRTNARGIADMFGNIWEWCAKYELAIGDPNDHTLPGVWAWERVASRRSTHYPLRGGCYLGDLSRYVPELDATSFTDEHATRHTDLGFRIACAIRLEALPPSLQSQLHDGSLLSVSLGQEAPDLHYS